MTSSLNPSLSSGEVERGVNLVLAEKQIDPLVGPALVFEIQTDLHKQLEAGGNLFVLDRAYGGGGAAFLWEDMLAMDDAFKVLELALNPLSPEKQARLLVRLVLFWRHLRGKRVMLDETSFRVMLCVKRLMAASEAEISEKTGLPLEIVSATVAALAARDYREEIKLVERDEQGKWSTRF